MDIRTDSAWMKASQRYRAAKAQSEAAEQELADAKEELLHAAGGEDAKGFGVSVKWQERKGSIDYKKAVTDLMPGLDVEPFRKDGSGFFKVDVSKE